MRKVIEVSLLWMLVCMLDVTAKLPVIVAHRGASGYKPENTLSAFKYALGMNAPILELDVQICQTGEIVVIHDTTLDRTTNGRGKVKNINCTALRQLNAGDDQKIPFLYEVLDLVNKKAKLMIEIKDPDAIIPFMELINDYITKKKWRPEQFIIISGRISDLKKVRQLNQSVPLGIIFDQKKDYFRIAKQLNIEYLILNHKLITKNIINSAHSAHLKIFGFTINKKNIAQKFKQLLIDGIITDYPDILNEFRSEKSF